MTLKRINDEENPFLMFGSPHTLADIESNKHHIIFEAGAKAQLETDQKVFDDADAVWRQILRDIQTIHKAVVKEIFEWIEKAKTTPLGYDEYGSYLWNTDVKAKKQKYGGK